MTKSSRATRFTQRLRRRQPQAARAQRRRTSYRPLIDHLEARNLLTTFTVMNDGDSGAGSLRQAILDANASAGPDTIEFKLAEDTITLNTGQLVITDDLTIRGPGAEKLTINGGGDRVFAIVPEVFANDPDGLYSSPTLDQLSDAPEVSITQLSISDGVATNAIGYPEAGGFAFGGGIYNMGGSLRLDGVNMSNNAAIANGLTTFLTAGGAVANEFGGSLKVSRSHFENNSSQGIVIAVGGAITSDLGQTVSDEGIVGQTGQPRVNIDRSEFVRNSANALFGYIAGEPFTGLGGGGAILNVTGTMSVSQSHFEMNEASGGTGFLGFDRGGAGFGGAILSGDISPFGMADSSLTVSDSSFNGNAATGGSGGSSGGRGGEAAGGAISVGNAGDAGLSRNTFESNRVTGGMGSADQTGGIGTGGAVAVAGGATLRSQRNEYLNNTAAGGVGTGTAFNASGRGGGLGIDSIELAGFLPGTASASSHRDTFSGNTAIGGIGGGIYNEGDLSLNQSVVSENTAAGDVSGSIEFVPGYSFVGAALGGGISNIGSLDVKHSTFEGNVARGANGAIGPNVLISPPDTAATYPGLSVGGGLHNINEASIKHSRFVANEALGGAGNFGSFAGVANGGGIYNDGALSISHSSIHENVARGGSNNLGDINAGGGYGGGITSGSVTFLEFVDTGEGRDATLDVRHSSIDGNEAVGGDGNLPLFPVPGAHLPAGGIGGGIVVYQGSASISHTNITDNLARGGEGGNGGGGGVYFFGFVGYVNASVSKSVISGNSAVGGDGGNGLGGGVAIGSLGSFLVGRPTTVLIDRTDIVGNTAQGGSGGDGLGGGIFNDADAITVLRRSTVTENEALGEGYGGGIYNLGDLKEIRAKIFANWASIDGDDRYDADL